MKLSDLGRLILEGEGLEDKLVDFSINEVLIDSYDSHSYQLRKNPGRSSKLKFSDKQLKFPKKSTLHLPERRAVALHFFANHELLAIEMMAAALIIFPTLNEQDIQLKNGLLATIKDEQKHFKLYLERMNELGIDFGDLPLSDFFWRYMDKIKTADEFYAVVALTFEAANLDFANYYQGIFKDVDDLKTAQIMNTVYIDEISHVKRGNKWLLKNCGKENIWNYYCSLLPENMTPDRAKGIEFDKNARMEAGLDEAFINNVKNYKSDFLVTNRKEWKK